MLSDSFERIFHFSFSIEPAKSSNKKQKIHLKISPKSKEIKSKQFLKMIVFKKADFCGKSVSVMVQNDSPAPSFSERAVNNDFFSQFFHRNGHRNAAI